MKISILTSSSLTPEQRDKSTLETEDLDLDGVISRNKVVDQTVFDVMLIRFLIEQPQHEAAHCFLETISKSGMMLQSPSLEGGSSLPAHAVGDQIGQRRMAFSDAFRMMVKEAGEYSSGLLLKVMGNIYFYKNEMRYIETIAKEISNPLWALSKHYGTGARRDPRRILKSQVGGRKKGPELKKP